MTRVTKAELVDLIGQCEAALVEEQDAHAQTKAARDAATGRFEEIGELVGKWRERLGGVPGEIGPAKEHAEKVIELVNGARATCASDLRIALASTGPSLRERVEGALTEVRAVAGRMQANAPAGEAKAYGLNRAADLVQAALEGE